MFGKNILTKSEQKHLREANIKTLYDFKATRIGQKELESQFPKTKPCWECEYIARKLGLED